MRVLITGGHGLVGREIALRFAADCEVRALGRSECDVTSLPACRNAVAEFRPDVVVHCAAYTAVDRAEAEEAKAFAVNASGTRNVALACREQGAVVVTFGSDYVFDGAARRPYVEDDPTRPLSAYGRSKLAAEEALRDAGAEYLLMRSQWLYGPHGRNFVFAILDKAKRGETLRVVADQTGCPTFARDLADATKRLIDAGARGVFHFSNEGETTWFEFASFIVAHSLPGPVDVLPASSREMPYPAARPVYSVLGKEKYRRATGSVPRRWEEALLDFFRIAVDS